MIKCRKAKGSTQLSLLADVTILFTLPLVAADELPLYQFSNPNFKTDSTTDL